MNQARLGSVLFLTLAAGSATAQWSTDSLSLARSNLGAATLGNEVFFAGGYGNSGSGVARVDIYDDGTGMWTTAQLTTARGALAATSLGTEVLFAGGNDPIAVVTYDTVDIYNSATGMWTTAQLSIDRSHLAAASVGTKALFAGGYWTDTVDIYDQSTGIWSTATLSSVRGDLTATTVGSKVLFAGGWDGAPSNVVDIYDDSTGFWSTATLSVARDRLASTTVGTKAIFGGGGSATIGIFDTVDIYDDSTGMWSTATLSAPREYLAATTVGNRAYFVGGYNGVAFADSAVADIYDDTTGTWSVATVSAARWGLAATSVGNKGFFGGGAGSDVVDIYTEAGSLGTNYCISTVNSTGSPSMISATGTESITANDLTLSADNLPAQPGIFIAGPGQAQVPFFNGFLCIDSNGLQRFSSVANPAGGVISEAVDYATSAPGGLNVVAGASYYYQRWNRDPAGGGGNANFSDGLEIVHTP